MAENEIELSGKFGLPELGGFAAKLEGRWKRSWTGRGNQLMATAVARADITLEELGRRLEQQEQLTDMFWRAISRASAVSDPEYRDTLAQLLGAAFEDDALIDEVDHMIAQIVKLDPLHLRVLRTAYVPHDEHPGNVPPEAEWLPFEDAERLTAIAVITLTVVTRLGVSDPAAEAALAALVSVGFMRERDTSSDVGGTPSYEWKPTPYAAKAMKMIYPHLEDVSL